MKLLLLPFFSIILNFKTENHTVFFVPFLWLRAQLKPELTYQHLWTGFEQILLELD